jgi:hypothetical protein
MKYRGKCEEIAYSGLLLTFLLLEVHEGKELDTGKEHCTFSLLSIWYLFQLLGVFRSFIYVSFVS